MTSIAIRLARNVRMALHPPQEEKLIFGPSEGKAPQFTLGTLHRADLNPTSPIPQFHTWYTQARSAGLPAPQTCVLSTASLPSGRVSSRVVYLKELDASGAFVIYSNFGTSRKAEDLETNSSASLVFWWEPLQRQVRVEGVAARMTPQESQAYYDTRERGSRIGAWASKQSVVLEPVEKKKKNKNKNSSEMNGVQDVDDDNEDDDDDDDDDDIVDDGRERLEGWVHNVENRFEGRDKIPCPDYWGGLRIVPDRVEFWQGRKSRLHDRFVYERESPVVEGSGVTEAKWTLNRLSP
ncbi:hypothetical protein jhhlp_003857 [Lomentospora prolificans]|uniref:pyridoxal 5'-phosphate synthase n=1 Tax=Lomentospora prolificans TaxID=41688 RepID=A0A2N3N9X8_9PEZI|nr:hypothetical protein jhhlp_003857 [Lomentospora prolificans]